MTKINRRDFLKTLGVGAAAMGTASLTGCGPKQDANLDPAGHHTSEVPVGQMTYRTFPGLHGDQVSILGYGCMRWPTTVDANGNVTAKGEATFSFLFLPPVY